MLAFLPWNFSGNIPAKLSLLLRCDFAYLFVDGISTVSFLQCNYHSGENGVILQDSLLGNEFEVIILNNFQISSGAK